MSKICCCARFCVAIVINFKFLLSPQLQVWYSTDRDEFLVARLLCLDAGRGDVRLMKCHEMAGDQEWVVKPSQGGEGVTIYNPSAGQCLILNTEEILTLGICGGRDTAVWRQEEI